MQELISALTAHEEECSREFEADLSAFCTRHMDAQLVQQLRQLVAEGEEDLAYRAFYALTIIYRNRKDYQQLQALFEENPRFAGHPSYHHLLILFQLEAETFFDALELLELAREDARQHRDNAGYLHLFAHLFVYTCEKSRGEMREQVRREYYDDVERAVEDAIRLDPAYAKFYCTKARVVAQRGRYGEAYSLINKAVATESSARKDYALRLLDYRHCETVILLQEQREYFQGEMEKLRRSVPSLPKLKTFVPGRGPKAYEGAEPYCFVSYAHINSDRVYPIVEQLMQRGIRLWFQELLELLFQSAALVIDTIRTFFLIALSILGPIAFALSVYDGFQSTLTQWITRYISIYMWLPVSDLFSSVLARIQVLMLTRDIEAMSDPTFIPDSSNTVYIIFLIIGIFGYFTIPTVANWIIMAGGVSHANRAMNQTATKVGNVAAAGAGAAVGNIAGKIVK